MKAKKPQVAKPVSLMEQARRGMIAVFDDSTTAVVNGKVKAVEEGSAYLLKSVEVIGDGRLRLTAAEGGTAEVLSSDVRIYMGGVADWRIEMFLVEHGYEARTYEGVQCRHLVCRDFSGNHAIEKQVANLNALASVLVDSFRTAPEGKKVKAAGRKRTPDA